jgi:hypothetical protein
VQTAGGEFFGRVEENGAVLAKTGANLNIPDGDATVFPWVELNRMPSMLDDLRGILVMNL